MKLPDRPSIARRVAWIAGLALLILPPSAIQSQDVTESSDAPVAAETREEQLRRLKLEQARLVMEQAQAWLYKRKADWKDTQRGWSQDYFTGQEVNRAKEEYEQALILEPGNETIRKRLESIK